MNRNEISKKTGQLPKNWIYGQYVCGDDPSKHMRSVNEYQKNMDELRGDLRLYQLPHLKRACLGSIKEVTGMAADMMQPGMSVVANAWCQLPVREAGGIGSMLKVAGEHFGERKKQNIDSLHGSTNNGAAFTMLMSATCANAGWKHFQISDELEDALCLTDIKGEIPARTLQIPFGRTYIEFGETRKDRGCYVHNSESGRHFLESVYLIEYDSGNDKFGPCRTIEITTIGSPVGKSDFMDDAVETFMLTIPLSQEDEGLNEIIDLGMKLEQEYLNMPGAHTPSKLDYDERRKCINHIAKALLFINSDAVVKNEIREGTEAQKRIAETGPKKRAKVERTERVKYNRIVISAKEEVSSGGGVTANGSKATHWRRGHFRQQPYGENLSLRKTLWIRPALIGSLKLNEPEDKVYMVKK